MTGDPNATHLQALVWAILHTQGPILELGVGWYSTPVVAAVSWTGRLVVSVEVNEQWREWATDRWMDGHAHYRVEEPADGVHPVRDEDWGLVLVDHGYASRRAESVRRYRGATLVVHDTQPGVAALYPGLAEALAEFPRRQNFTMQEPWTTVVSG